ncbi:uncharacterized protein LOC113214862 isoform X1 [Frankliniella occidentalis]|uniref:Uncharacterized protein LOC113214862 isoform X1 n=1 Tax=Frankliniella occidentalis TaxID=133901 RepID=A0A9C6TSA6_FRAOC|nr:uncharacterized protein LOC113214862 isoform X1 [Frankliniella occidentalis]
MARGALLVLLLAAPALSSMYPDLSEFKKGLKMNAQRCANAHHVQYLQVMAMMEAPMRTGYDRNSKCFICCLMEKYEMLTPDGEFMDGTMRRYALDLPESQFKTVVNKYLDLCLREGGSQRQRKTKEYSAHHSVDLLLNNDDICEKCYQFAKCYYDRSKVKPDGSRKQYYQRQHLNNYYEGSSGRLFQSVGNWASNQWNHATNGPKGLRDAKN